MILAFDGFTAIWVYPLNIVMAGEKLTRQLNVEIWIDKLIYNIATAWPGLHHRVFYAVR